MKNITVKIRDEDYCWFLTRAQEILNKFAQAGKPMSLTPEEILRISLQDRALRAIGDGISAGFAEAESLIKRGETNADDQ
ncbi:hypothetical protein [Ruminococcus flavefaciens]|uniref:hypothetical protein n=1 Tax=Ruminococcus flavefaciens TaxID=1265 RepID=UPI0026F12B58|nr:hypothetical protein [Ruminococcus flavefaciens]